ncbi:hypothetical protein OE647_19765 [Defluviimonas sp. WL0075]|uniref:PRTase-CE domain-containing protein n=1 Tax=Albidovulum sediminicola TaxID=2984331 RepID=A0ABT2Z872_9RHOB|nr:hypothetical protein [Defluviimonas sp. WL0075]
MAKYIRENILTETPVAIVATAWGDKPDSSQQLVQRLKVQLRSDKNVEFFNSVNAFERKDHIKRFPRFILVDEFSGTGETVANRLKHIGNHAKANGTAVDPYVCMLFGMEKASEKLVNLGYKTYFCAELKAGISGYFNDAERDEKIALMQRLEEELAPAINGEPMPSLGHGQAEALFFIKNMNAPNSNFPILWWPKDAQDRDRDTIMHRAEL